MACSPLDHIASVDGFSLVLLELSVAVGFWCLHRVFDGSRVFLDWNRAVPWSYIAGVVEVAAGIEFVVILSLVLVVGATVVGLVRHVRLCG